MPISAITRSPLWVSAGGRIERDLRRRERHRHRRFDRLSFDLGVSADTPVGRSMATTGTPRPLTSATTVSSSPLSCP